ncbi:restriction endonuclease subunit S [Pseudoalteromonas sp. GW168-MNA-CIBAN-0100]|uniref:restriction endonuclease subunit S n=1 Tax=Pseudoalteromonas sp. GW168-MNA-CIBAN-0100 TaxID=3140434 RepID=UPI00331866D1
MIKSKKIPLGWKSTTLGTFMEFKNGINADKSAYGQGTEFINVMDIFKNHFLKRNDIQGKVQITEKQKAESAVVYGDLLFNRTSEVPNEIAYSSVYLDQEEITFGGFVIRGRQQKDLLDPYFAGYCFNSSSIRRELIRRSQGVVRANIGQKDLNKVPILIPPKAEQKQIAFTIALWDSAIEKTETLISAKEKQFEWLVQRLFKPTESWRLYKLSDLFENRRETKNIELPLISITREKGVIPHSETNRKDNSNEDKSKYLRICPNDIGYNTMRMWQGVSALSAIDGIVSPAYTVCTPKTIVNPEFMAFLFKTKPMIHKFYRYSQGLTSDTWNLKFHHFSEVKASIPDIETQVEIAKVLNSAKKEIAKLRQFSEKYRLQKRGLMQKLLIGEWQVSVTPATTKKTLNEVSV